jgi:succinyl-CoA synthetase beta subunit
MASFGVRVQRGKVANTSEEALKVATWLRETGAKELICKAQIHAGGRGKGTFKDGYKSGVHICAAPEEVSEAASHMIGNSLITKQTTSEGQPCHRVLVHEGINFNKEFYLAILMDRATHGPVIVASTAGGMEIEEVAHTSPEKIFTVPVSFFEGLQPEHTAKVASALGFEGEAYEDARVQIANLFNLFMKCDCTQVEINPFVLATDGKVYCVDAKLGFDDNAEFRQKQIYSMRDIAQEDPREVAASKFNLNYVGLDGNIGCMVNGAGLAMATMDIIKLYGGEPANFLDVGGGANEKQVEEAFKIILADSKVQAVLVNIFGGIMKCDTIATGIINAAKKLKLTKPLVVRLQGTNVEKGMKLLKESGINCTTAVDLDDAAKKACAALKH